MKTRITIYLSPRKDQDLIEFLDRVESGDLSVFVRELIRDGIKWRMSANPPNGGVNPPALPASETIETPLRNPVRNTTSVDKDLDKKLDSLF